MKKLIPALLASAFMVASPAAPAADASPLLQKGGCIACHSVDKKVLGPAFKDVAAKYRGKDVKAALVKKVKEGGSGVWGPIPMPSNAGKLSDEEFAEAVEWVLSL